MTDTNLNRDTQASNWLDFPTREGWWWLAYNEELGIEPVRIIATKTPSGKSELKLLAGNFPARLPSGRYQKILPWIGSPFPNYKPKHN